MRKILVLLVVLVSGGVGASEPPTILIFGDSLSAGYGIEVDQSWVTLLQARLGEQGYEHRVVNASISGETSEGVAARIDAALETFSPALVILELGGNDGLRGFPPGRMRANLDTVITKSAVSGADVVMLGIRIPPNYGQRYTEAFENVFRELADEHGIPWIEFFLEGVALDAELMQADGIHPNAAAQPILLDNAWPIIEQTLANEGAN
ncbi:MAG TPA: arylesterase [Woeseiaceae bacterium]|jgi:acyl-CoA thioesterase-1|nr:arylesterase [Woeseiaceae bacterium]